MGELLDAVNWLAVGLGFLISFTLGWLWYSPKWFGQTWAKGVGISLDKQDAPPVAALLVQAIGTFLLAWLVGVTAANQAMLTLVLIVLTLVFILAGAGLFVKKSSTAILIEIGFIVAMTVIMVICQAIF
jgi:hypothetical protein